MKWAITYHMLMLKGCCTIGLGSFHTCAQLDNGKVKCFVYNLYGQLVTAMEK